MNAEVKTEAAAQVTEADLAKSLAELEGKKPEPTPAPTPTSVKVEEPGKFADTVQQHGSEQLAKALDVSPILDEVTTLIGVHLDDAMGVMQKSIQAAADRDLAVIEVLRGLKKSIEDNTEALNKLMEKPGAPAATRPITTKDGDVLVKSVAADPARTDDSKKPNPAVLKKSILDGLQKLHLKARQAGDHSEMARLAKSVTIFESTNKITNEDLNAALGANK